jgi:endonuclease-3 related protein
MTQTKNFTAKRKGGVTPSLQNVYTVLYKYYGPQDWWPGDTRFEIIVGAILTQNTAWTNVEKAITNLKKAGVLNPAAMNKASEKSLASFIRPAGYYNIKAKRLKNFLELLFSKHRGSLVKMSSSSTTDLKKDLIAVNGIGPETCDSILLYAFNKPTFVIDAYTKRIFSRHGIFPESATYHEVQKLFLDTLPRDVQLFNEYHALIVRLAKEHCRTKPICTGCPLHV